MTMGVLAVRTHLFPSSFVADVSFLQPYRSRGLGSQSLQTVLDAAAASTRPKIHHIYLHVQVSNTEGKQFYERHGFKEIRVHENYYSKLQPRDAWVLQRDFNAA
jgi:ribosomal protein S18 acetylase RimI-like enzyme